MCTNGIETQQLYQVACVTFSISSIWTAWVCPHEALFPCLHTVGAAYHDCPTWMSEEEDDMRKCDLHIYFLLLYNWLTVTSVSPPAKVNMLAVHTPKQVRTADTLFKWCVWLCVEIVHLVWVFCEGGLNRKDSTKSGSESRWCPIQLSSFVPKQECVCVWWLWERKLQCSYI